jgi:undecaprenyl-phosphate 4-deoxy-4-formamido-L-arabinose transferase
MDEKPLTEGISVVIPVYNSEANLDDLITRLAPVLKGSGVDFEALLVDDGSRDSSWAAICSITRSCPWVRGIHLMRNYGQHNALLCGLRFARYSITVTMDDDLQNPPEEIPILTAKINEGFDVVYGVPLKQQHGIWRNLASYITRLTLQSTMGVENARKVSAFRALRTTIRQAFSDYQSPFVVLDVLLAWGTTRFASTPVQHEPRLRGVSNYTLSRLILHAINMLTGFTVLPLQMASLMGFGFALFGMLVFLYVVGRFIIEGGSVPGFPFLASIIAIFSGVQLFALGIIGEYLARMHFRIMEKPAYVVREKTEPHENL